MRIVELIIDEDQEIGIEAISVVENPAIEEDFVALKSQEFKLAEVDNEKRILLGALLVPNKPIYRRNGEDEYYIYFSKDTVLKASQMFLQQGKQNNSTLEHQHKLNGLSLVESWIVEDPKMDKTQLYGMDLPKGTWVGAVKVNNEQIWSEFVKTGRVKGFSIEGYFADKMERPKDKSIKDELAKIEEEEAEYLLKQIGDIVSAKKITLESYTDYPESVKNNARKGIDLNKKVNNKCATEVGKIRAQQLAQGKAISEQTIKRMYSFLSRAEEYYDESDDNACGTISYLLWGGLAGKRYAAKKLKELGELSLNSMVVNDDFAIIDDRLAYSTEEKAKEMSKDLGCEGIHQHEYDGKTWYMPCEYHSKEDMYTDKCPKGYKKKNGKCTKMAEVGPRGGIKKSPKAPRPGTPNKNPKGKGTAKGDAKTTRSAKVTQKDRATLQKKSDDFNKRYKEKLGYGVTVGMLSSVYQRGLGAFNTSSSPAVKSASQWAFARVNAFLYLVKNGRPENSKYKQDNDLLPAKHPKSSK